MILLDLNGTTFSTLYATIGKGVEVNKELLQYIILNCIRSYNMKFKNEYGDMVICTDSRHCWRKDVFPYYKASRKKARDNSLLNWPDIFRFFDEVKAELVEFFPYPLIAVDKAEADDIIAVICRAEELGSKNLILSADTDLCQLHDWRTDQYDPVRKRSITISNPTKYLKEHIIEGDAGDGIPNVLSDDDTFVTGKRQKQLTKKRKEYLLSADVSEFTSSIQHNYHRNRELIDLSRLPQKIIEEIHKTYISTPRKNKSKLFNYFYDKKLVKLMDKIQEF